MRTSRLLPALYLGLALIVGLLWPLSQGTVSIAQAHEAQADTAAISSFAIPQAQAGTGIVRVALTGTNGAGCGSIAAPCATIQFAVDEALAGEEIHVAAGIYNGVILRAGTLQQVYISKTLTLRGGYSVSNWAVSDPVANPTILDAAGGGRVILAISPFTVENLSLINGNFNASAGLFADVGLTMSNVNVLSNTATLGNGGGVGVDNGQVTVTGGRFENNQAQANGGGLDVLSGTVTISGTQFISNTSVTGHGGGIGASHSIQLTNGYFERNQAQTNGGGLLTFSNLNVADTQFISNTSGDLGGGFSASTLTMSNVQLFSNTAAVVGGGGYVASTATVQGGLVQSNRTNSSVVGTGGAGLWIQGTLELSGTQFLSNTAGRNGGGLNMNSVSVLTNALFQNNLALNAGGGIIANTAVATSTLVNVQFISNTAQTNSGGGLLANSPVTVINSLFERNLAGINGGGLNANNLADLSETQFISNTAQQNGGGSYVSGNALVNGGSFENNRSITAFGGGLLVEGTLTLTGTQFISNQSGNSAAGGLAVGLAQLNGGLFQNNRANGGGAGGFYAASGVTLTNTQFLSNTAANGGAGGLFVQNGLGTLNGGLFQNNRSLPHVGGAIQASNLLVTGTQFISNASALNGGALDVTGSLTATSAQFLRNNANTYGGAIQTGGPIVISDGLFQDNRAQLNGGGISTPNTVVITNTDFISNSATGNIAGDGGGAVAASGAITISGGQFVQNRTDTADGGAIWAASTLNLTGVAFLTNTASLSDGNGGAVQALGAVIATGGRFQGNAAAATGGGLSAGGLATLNGVEFVNNSIGNQGGAVYFNNGGALADLILDQNTAGFGGGFYLNAGTLSQTGGMITLSNNLANNSGGGVYINDGALTLNNARLLTNTATNNGGGLHQAGGATSVTNSCIVANSDTAANHGAGAAITATGNWWGAANGPSGVAPGGGDSVSANVDFSGFLSSAIAGCSEALKTDLLIAKTINAPLASAGDPVIYTLAFTNSGPGVAENILITDVVPVSITRASLGFSSNVTITPTGGISYAWQAANLGTGQSGIITISGVLSNPLALGSFTNTATITTTTVDTDTTNNTGSAKLTVIDPLVFVVNVTGDGVDTNPGDGLCEMAPDECSLRAALMEANASLAVSSTIRFDIPGAGVQTIIPATPLPTITHPVLIDGLSQPQASCATWPPTLLVELQGPEIPVLGMSGLVIGETNNVTVRGLVINRFGTGSGIGVIGDAKTGNNHRIECNFLGTTPDGNSAVPNAVGLGLLSANNNVISGNLISGNTPQSGLILIGHGFTASGNTIRNNRIGTNAAGTADLGNQKDGILILNAKNNLVRDNLISGNNDDGLDISDLIGSHPDLGFVLGCEEPPCATNNNVRDNRIGTDENGLAILGNGDEGVQIEDARGNTIRNNLIAGNGANGVMVIDHDQASCTHESRPCAIRNRIISNTIFSNAGLGIDLALGEEADGVTANDAGDNDEGPNLRQNFPALTLAVLNGGNLEIEGSLDSSAGPFTLQFFGNASCDPTNHGEGEVLLGTRTLAASGPINVTFPIPDEKFIAATATDANGNTSEFSACVPVIEPVDLQLSKVVVPESALPGETITYTVTFSNTGTTFASQVRITDIIPVSLTNVSVAISSDMPVIDTGASPAYVWTMESLGQGQGGVITITGEISPNLAGGIITNTATITSSTFDIDPGNNNDTAVVNVGTPPALSLRKTVIPTGDVPYHGLVTYTLVISNSGGTPASGVALTDTLPISTTFAEWITRPGGAANTAGQVSWGGTVAANAAITLTFVVSHTGNYGDVVTNTAQYVYQNTPGSSNTATFTVEPALVIEPIYLPLIVKLQPPFEGP